MIFIHLRGQWLGWEEALLVGFTLQTIVFTGSGSLCFCELQF